MSDKEEWKPNQFSNQTFNLLVLFPAILFLLSASSILFLTYFEIFKSLSLPGFSRLKEPIFILVLFWLDNEVFEASLVVSRTFLAS